MFIERHMSINSLLVLIITNENDEHNNKLEQLQRSRWSHYKSVVKCKLDYYFLKARPNLEEDYIVEGDNFYVKTEESIKPGILLKTLKAFEVLSPKFDFTLRMNISSIILLHRYLKWLERQPTTDLFAGTPHPFGIPPQMVKWAFGAAYTVSKDVAQRMCIPNILDFQVDNGLASERGNWKTINDDVYVSYVLLYHYKLKFTPYFNTEIFRREHCCMVSPLLVRDPHLFFLRVKLLDGSSRLELEPQVHETVNQIIFHSSDM